ncbi:MAG: DUF192 domain-containing protein [Methyloceanibacter sp.]|uniref:DUF192 domain-containing protein n=1 Tax=Methyloceanibacter sp. TaxID=1965321 RepID=UPI003D6CF727
MLARLAAACLFALTVLESGAGSFGAGTGTVVLETDTGEHRFEVEVATSDGERALGLMFRRSLPETGGMLFLYDRPQPAAMWMRNTYIPLDMIFISAGGRVHRIEANTEPFSTEVISSSGEVVGVLELNAGQAEKIGLKRGDRVVYPGLAGAAAPKGMTRP